MEDRETARMRKYGESKTTRIMMATVPHVTSGFGLRKFQADGFLLTRVYITVDWAKAGYCVRLVGRTLLRQQCVAGQSLRDRPDKIVNVSGVRKAVGRMTI